MKHNSQLLMYGLTMLCLLYLPNPIFGQCNLNDWQALKALYESTNGNKWENN